MIGGILCVLEETQYPTWCWHQVIAEYMKEANEVYGSFENALAKYVSWANQNDICVNSDEIRALFQKYSQPVTQATIDEYLRSSYYGHSVFAHSYV